MCGFFCIFALMKTKRIYSIKKLRKEVIMMIKDDFYFRSLIPENEDMFFYFYDRATQKHLPVKFYVFYNGDLPYACVGLLKNEVRFFFIDISYRKKKFVQSVLDFINKKTNNTWFVGTTKKNSRFVEFANKNQWSVFVEDDNEIIFKICQ